jgi:hypothetical protein
MTYGYDPSTNDSVQAAPLQETNIWAIASLVSGVLGWLGLFGLGGLAAVICGHVAIHQIRASQGKMGGEGLATAGLVLGYLNLALVLVSLCLLVLVALGVISAAVICPFYFNGAPSF